MSIFRLTLFSAVAVLLLPAVRVSAATTSVDAEYTGGTAKDIPMNSFGTLSLADTKELQFHYGASVYRVSYDQITGSDIQAGETRHLFHRIPVPNFVPIKKRETLSISFHDSTGHNGTLNFELSSRLISSTQSVLNARMQKEALTSDAGSTEDNWWGDRWWKTNRNQETWGSEKQKQAEAAPATTAPPGATAAK